MTPLDGAARELVAFLRKAAGEGGAPIELKASAPIYGEALAARLIALESALLEAAPVLDEEVLLENLRAMAAWPESDLASYFRSQCAAAADLIERLHAAPTPLVQDGSDVDRMISMWSMRPAPGSPTGKAWEDGCRQGFEWGRATPERSVDRPTPAEIQANVDHSWRRWESHDIARSLRDTLCRLLDTVERRTKAGKPLEQDEIDAMTARLVADTERMDNIGRPVKPDRAVPAHITAPEGWKTVPFEPTEDQWGKLARDIVMWMNLHFKHGLTAETLREHLTFAGRRIPAWLDDELRDKGHLPKGTVATLIYKAMLDAAPQPLVEGGSMFTYGARDWPEDAPHENGNYMCQCCECDQQFIGHKRRVTCKVCASVSCEHQWEPGWIDGAGNAPVRFCTKCKIVEPVTQPSGGGTAP